jgi:CheY-like chemotaxis protein
MQNDLNPTSMQPYLLQSEPFAPNGLLKGLRILLVDDGPDNRALMKRFLETSCAIVDVASNGAEAIEISRVRKFDVILMDMQMPVLDGY